MNRHLHPGTRATAVSALVVASLSLSACSGGSASHSPSSSPSTAAARGPITLATGKDTSGNLEKLVDGWNAKHPKETVTINELPAAADGQLQQLVQNAQVQSDAYSVLALDITWTSEFAANRWIDKIPTGIIPANTFPSAIDSATYRGTTYAIPWQSNGGLLFYRSDLLRKAGISNAPTTWTEMQADCAKVLALPDTEGASCYAGQFDKYEGLVVNFAEAVQSADGELFDKDGKPTVNTAESKSALTWLVDRFKDKTIPAKSRTYQEENGRKEFQDGKLVFLRQWPYVWDLANKTDGSSKVAGKFDVAPLPGKNGPGSSTLGGLNLAVSSFTKNKATALDFITYLASPETQRANLLATSQAPTLTSLYDDPELQKKFPYLPALKESINQSVPRPKVVRYGDVSSAIQEAVYPVIAGQAAPEEALSSLQKKLEQITTP
ncbi:multiple sugar transport system substrate-binding protein [Streptomyces sp. SLBN-118]|uniref:ABC transporter substrate-binding protein n=1 Tax=Streptomyces sp. SLBN-118 TaxID=2768454 RepID=UPI001152D208|nr:ABC transporter substrate-binding protein [Streptomyces sp. SLBN-118]TQK50754.1 multiple sugar transport system substrate-binding protein [Streptomyces sp. SLBN-118]